MNEAEKKIVKNTKKIADLVGQASLLKKDIYKIKTSMLPLVEKNMSALIKRSFNNNQLDLTAAISAGVEAAITSAFDRSISAESIENNIDQLTYKIGCAFTEMADRIAVHLEDALVDVSDAVRK